MFRNPLHNPKRNRCFPRIRGDVPSIGASITNSLQVFPACAGMFRLGGRKGFGLWGFPSMRGDAPESMPRFEKICLFSPHARGCSPSWKKICSKPWVFPACAGMFLLRGTPSTVTNGFPRMRGDVPEGREFDGVLGSFSPHARGCSLITGAKDKNQPVFPACAGMFLRLCKVCCGRTGFPRMRGDVPYGRIVSALVR